MIVKDFDDMRIGTTPLSKLYYGHDLIWKRKDEGLVIITTETNIFTVPRMDYSSVTGTIDWGDGQTDEYNSDTSITHNYLDLKSWTIKINAPIEILGNKVFYDCSSLTSITIPDSVTSIGELAFAHCTSLTSIIIPDSVTSIGAEAFWGCTSLTSVTISNSVTNISWYTFSKCTSLTSVTISNSVTNIESYVFIGCSSLVSITIPISVKSIGNHAFRNTGLTSVTIAQDCKYYSQTFPSGCVINRY